MADAGRLVGPSLDARKQALDPRPIALHNVAGLACGRVEGVAFPSVLAVDENGNQIFGAGKNEDIGFFARRNISAGPCRFCG